MNGAQDLGGMMGFGRIDREPDEPWFHADWERRALGLTLAMGATGQWTIDMSRAARESLHPADRALFESIAGPLLAELGYAVGDGEGTGPRSFDEDPGQAS